MAIDTQDLIVAALVENAAIATYESYVRANSAPDVHFASWPDLGVDKRGEVRETTYKLILESCEQIDAVRKG